MEADDALAASFVSENAAVKVVALFNSTSDKGVKHNALMAVGALAEASPAGVQAALDAGAIPMALSVCSPSSTPPLQEASVDHLCKLAAHSDAAKAAEREAGAVPALASLLSPDCSNDVRVRALLALGMLLEGHEESQLQLASSPGGVSNLLALMRQDADGDCQQIAASLFMGLSKAAAPIKEAMSASMRTAHDNKSPS